MLDRKFLYVWFLVGILLLAWRPFYLGIYVDDWFYLMQSSQLSPDWSMARWYMLELAQNRPALRAFSWVLTSLVPAEPFALQSLAVVLTIATAIVFAAFSKRFALQFVAEKDASMIGHFAAMLWLAAPFVVPVTFWPTGTTSLLSAICFFASGAIVVTRWSNAGIKDWLLVALIAVWGHLTYEAFYLQYVVLLVFLFFIKCRKLKPAFVWFAVLTIPQLFALGYNRYLRATGAEGSRKFDQGLIDVLFHWMSYPGRIIGVEWLSWPVLASIIALVGCGIVVLLSLWQKRRDAATLKDFEKWAYLAGFGALLPACLAVMMPLPISMVEGLPLFVVASLFIGFFFIKRWPEVPVAIRRGLLIAILIIMAGMVLGGLAFAAGNYVIWAQGIGGRSVMVIAFWFVLGISILVVMTPVRQKWRMALSAVLFVSFVVPLAARAFDWHTSWTMQQEIMSSVPEMPVEEFTSDSLFIMQSPENPGWIPVVETNWQAGSMMLLHFVEMLGREQASRLPLAEWQHRWLISRPDIYRIEVSGQNVTLIDCETGEIHSEYTANNVWLWDRFAGTFSQIHKRVIPGCGAQ
ncbi:hypothetical protein MACH10_30860 [Thalassospira tepidiphila]|uniref:hypothetical protein n=1 Tax=Thalassospira tepidiphila TaxID=393657 RepID=UPI00291FEFA4|nr:hypothetical protein MACH10_30860 [Thalassospira tepidiphila]